MTRHKPFTVALERKDVVNTELAAEIDRRQALGIEVTRIALVNRASSCGPSRIRIETAIFSDGGAAQCWGGSPELAIGRFDEVREVLDQGAYGLDLSGSLADPSELPAVEADSSALGHA